MRTDLSRLAEHAKKRAAVSKKGREEEEGGESKIWKNEHIKNQIKKAQSNQTIDDQNFPRWFKNIKASKVTCETPPSDKVVEPIIRERAVVVRKVAHVSSYGKLRGLLTPSSSLQGSQSERHLRNQSQQIVNDYDNA
jgi:hypothetical protein